MYDKIENFPTSISKLTTILEAEARRNSRVRVLKGFEGRLYVECDDDLYLFLVTNTTSLLTESFIHKKIGTWERFEEKFVDGFILLAPYTDVSSTIASSEGRFLPKNVVIVSEGGWSDSSSLTLSEIDPQLSYLLEVFGITETLLGERISDSISLSNRPSPNDTQINAPTSSRSQRINRQLRTNMHLDAYHLEKRLGRGFSAEVWKAQVVSEIPGVELEIGDIVAIKIYSLAHLRGSQSIRVQREFDLAANTEHTRLARVYDLVISPSRPFHTFLVMEYVEGSTLKDYIAETGKLSYLQTATIGIQIFEALTELHSLGAIHRDVKAANIMLSKHDGDIGDIKLVDLGIVSVVDDNQLTGASVFLGSKHSAPLEQLSGQELDFRTDIYGAGSVLYHCLQGSPMYDGTGPEGAIVMKMVSSPASLPAVSTANSTELELIQFINSCIEVDRQKRPRSAEDCLDIVTRIRNNLKKK